MTLRIQSLYDRDLHPGLGGFEPSLTQQHFAEEVDINAIMARAEKGIAPPVKGTPMFGDFTQIGSYQDSLEAVQAADEAFMELPASVRIRFENDPGLLISFVQDSRNRDEAVKLGLIEPAPIAPVAPVPSPSPVPSNTVPT